ncbi:MAG: M36 family metallopeptidase [Planctomycetota bacterium]
MRLRLSTSGSFALLFLLASTSAAQVSPALFPGQRVPLPFLDTRYDDGETRAFVRAALRTSRTATATRTRGLDAGRLAIDAPGVRIDDHELFGTPHFVRSTLGFLSEPMPLTANGHADTRAIAAAFVERYPALFEVTAGELGAARVTRDFGTKHNGVRHLTLQQEVGGLELFGCQLKASVTARGELIDIASSMLPLARHPLVVPAATLAPAQAIRAAARDAGLALALEPIAESAPAGVARAQTWQRAAELRADVTLTTKLVAFPRTRTDVRPAWSVPIAEPGLGNTYHYLVDATNGEVLWRWNSLHHLGGTQPITMRVYTVDSPAPGSPGNTTPNGLQFPFVRRDLVTITPGEVVAYSPNHWIDDGGNETLGNNVDAHTDLNGDNLPDLPRPQGSPARVFDFPLDPSLPPSSYRKAAVTQLFWSCNRMHDRLYALGFDEVAHNFQRTNFGLGGAGSDRIQADAQDALGTNNANFDTLGTDGSGARMQMYVFDGPTPARDGSLDSDIVYHEYAHGLSIRLHEGSLFGEQSTGMGEGWGDFFGIAMNAEPGDDPHANYTMGPYTTLQFVLPTFDDNYYFGIRRFPYSTDFNVNPQTFADIDPTQQAYPPAVPRSPVVGNSADEVHNSGEVWCGVLLECRAALWSTLGFAANELTMQLVVDGMKLSPPNPSFLQARDAILLADIAGYAGVHLPALWSAFAKRGLGDSAEAPPSSTTTGIVEAFDIPKLLLFRFPVGIPSQLTPGVAANFSVLVLGVGPNDPLPGTGQLHYSINGAPFVSVPMLENAPNDYTATLPVVSCLDQIAFYVSSDSDDGVVTNPSHAPEVTRFAQAYEAIATVFSDDFETDEGWVATSFGATTGFWQRGVPINDPNWTADPFFDADGSGQCYLTQNQFGNTDVDDGPVELRSPPIDMSAGAGVRMSYAYYFTLSVETGDDVMLVEMSSNGDAGPWVEVARHDTDAANVWRTNEIDALRLAAFGVPLTDDMRVRFTVIDGGASTVVEGGLDAFRVERLVCAERPAAFCFGDGSLATPCPCAPPDTVPSPSGAAGAGCANSFHPGGGRLDFAGTLDPDTVVLTASDLSPAGFTFFVFGSSMLADGFAVGDGLRCVSGALLRFGSQNAVAGTALYPNPAAGWTTPLSTIGSTPPNSGITGYYQAIYRNAEAGFCSPGTINLTSGYAITWY